MGEEWRRGWHPERIAPRDTDDAVLVVGAGPAGLEAARALGRRGYPVLLVERDAELGGRSVRESTLPGLASWRRVSDWRVGQLRGLRTVEVVRGSEMTAELALEAECSLIAVATGSTWRRDGTGRYHDLPIPGLDLVPVFTPDDVMDGRLPSGRVLVFDDDHYYMGGVVAERLADRGCEVVFATPDSLVSSFTQYTGEQRKVQRRVMEVCAAVHTSTALTRLGPGAARLASVYTGVEVEVGVDAVVLVTGSLPNDGLYRELTARPDALREAGVRRVVRLGDCLAPALMAAAVHSGHLFARTLDTAVTDRTPYRRESVAPGWDLPLPPESGGLHLPLLDTPGTGPTGGATRG
ncbi:NAD(P)-binding protein [Actinosynnema sp. NPDC004786]